MLTIFDVVWWCLMSGVVSWQLEVVYSMFHSCRASPALHSYPFYFLVSRQYSKNHWINFRSKPPNSLNAFYALPQVELLDFPKMYKLFDVPVVKIESKCWWRSERDCLNPDAGVMPDAAVQALFFLKFIIYNACLYQVLPFLVLYDSISRFSHDSRHPSRTNRPREFSRSTPSNTTNPPTPYFYFLSNKVCTKFGSCWREFYKSFDSTFE